MKSALTVAAIAEIATGLGLLVVPGLVAGLLLGQDLAGAAVLIARVAGLALIGLGVACWPGPPRTGMLIYSTGVAVYLAYLGVTGVASGILLWPAVVAHALISLGLGVDRTRRGG